MKRLLSAFLSICMILSFLSAVSAVADEAAGYQPVTPKVLSDAVAVSSLSALPTDNTKNYTISTAEELNSFANMASVYKDMSAVDFLKGYRFYLIADIDMSAIENFGGIGCNGVDFKGCFDGQGYTISNLKMTIDYANGKNTDKIHLGLFSSLVEDAVVENVVIDSSCAFIVESVANPANFRGCGAISARVSNTSTIRNCKSAASITCKLTSMKDDDWGGGVGGLVGCFNSGSAISNCTSEGNVVSAFAKYGGIIGSNRKNIEPVNCLNTGTAVEWKEEEKPETELGYQPVTPQTLTNTVALSTLSGLPEDNSKNYTIGTAEELNNLAKWASVNDNMNVTTIDYLNGFHFYLIADIDMSSITDFAGIGGNGVAFKGHFDGQGYMISNLKMTVDGDNNINAGVNHLGLFGITIGDALIENVVLDATCSFTVLSSKKPEDFRGAAAIVARTDGNAEIRNCKNSSSVTCKLVSMKNDNWGGGVGGIVGCFRSAKPIKNCTNEGMVASFFPLFGGLIGANKSGQNPIDCLDKSIIETDEPEEVDPDAPVSIEGIVGYDKSKITNVDLTNVPNILNYFDHTESESFKITSGKGLDEFAYLSGFGVTFEGKIIYLANDINMADITKYKPVANFLGVFDGQGHIIDNLKLDRSSSDNWGVTVGIFGNIAGTAIVRNLIIGAGCEFRYTGNGADNCVGAVVGKLAGDAIIENCYSKATVVGNRWLGGIVGYIDTIRKDGCQILNCTNAGTVENVKDENSAGGIVGLVSTMNVTVSHCRNIGKIIVPGGSDNSNLYGPAGGIVARCWNSGLVIDSCINNGELVCNGKGGDMKNATAGAILGSLTVGQGVNASNAYIRNCLNYAVLNGTHTGICGYSLAKNEGDATLYQHAIADKAGTVDETLQDATLDVTPIYPPDDPGDEPGTGEVPTDPLVTSEEIPTVENPTEEVTTSGDQTETSVLEKPNDGCASVISASILLPLLAVMLILPALSEKRKNTDN